MTGVTTRRHAGIGVFEKPPKPIKIPRLEKSSWCEDYKSSELLTSLVTFEYGPPQLNLFKYIAEEACFIWRKTKETYILKKESEPLDGLILIYEDSVNLKDLCLRLFEFVPEATKSPITGTSLPKEKDYIVICYLGETFWNGDKTTLQEVKDVVRNAEESRLFFVIESVDGIEKKIKLVKHCGFCPAHHVIRADGDKSVIYDAFYVILESNLSSFLSDLETKRMTRHLSLYKSQLENLIRKLPSRKLTPVSKLTAVCKRKIKAGTTFGMIGYRVCGDTLYVLENEKIVENNEKRMLPIRKSIQDNFKGNVIFHTLTSKSFTPHCTVKCGGFLENADKDRKGTIGIFGKLKSATQENAKECSKIVILSSGHLFHEGEIAKISVSGDMMRIGHCIWPRQNESPSSNLHDVSVVQLDSSTLARLQQSIFNKKVIVDTLSKTCLNYRKVFKFGAATKETFGVIHKIDDFEIFGADVMVILPKSTDIGDGHGKFSDKGDSGAIVLTWEKDKLYAVGMVYGDQFDFPSAECFSSSNESIAIGLRQAVGRFTSHTKRAIEFDEI